MSKRHSDINYLMALGHNVICNRREESPDTRFHLVDFDDVSSFDIEVDLAATQMAMGQKTPAAWFAHYGDADTFTGGMTIGQKALMLGHLYESVTPEGWTTCLECSDGCDECSHLAIVPDEMIVRCPACEGDGSTPRGGSCHYCHTEGRIWASAEADVKADMADDGDFRAYGESTRRQQEGGTL